MERKIENDDQLQRSQEWLIEKAKQLDHPLMEGEAKAQMMVNYDFVSEKVEEYRRSQTERKFPSLITTGAQINPIPEHRQPEAETEAELKKQVILSDWMDE